jgi:1-aminocyclopropane-1-carboxylate deaminase/D-cysteine desulfhydrase-like pyridoxal-dependent ACC family enzyme
MKTSSISSIFLDGREFLVKRDDLFDPFLSGNKYRKLHILLNSPSENYNKIISYGGTQSNAMLAIAAMCKEKGWEFIYYTKPLSETLKKSMSGNFLNALGLGMKHIEIQHTLYKEYISSLSITLDEKSFIIDQGGAIKSASDGLKVLANEIRQQSKEYKFDAIATPSGTGTTALFLALELPQYKIYTTPCVGDVEYLKRQMSSLSKIPSNLCFLEPEKKYHFAKPYLEFLDIYKKTKDAGIEFDLLYAPSMWLNLLNKTKEKILYVHSGGVSGNESMLKRYSQKGFSL